MSKCAGCGQPLRLVNVHHGNGRVTGWLVCGGCETVQCADRTVPQPRPARPRLELVRP